MKSERTTEATLPLLFHLHQLYGERTTWRDISVCYVVLFCSALKGPSLNPPPPCTNKNSFHLQNNVFLLFNSLTFRKWSPRKQTWNVACALSTQACCSLMNSLSEMFVSCSVAKVLQTVWAAAGDIESAKGERSPQILYGPRHNLGRHIRKVLLLIESTHPLNIFAHCEVETLHLGAEKSERLDGFSVCGFEKRIFPHSCSNLTNKSLNWQFLRVLK